MNTQQKINGIIEKISKHVKENKNVAESIAYIMPAKDLATFMAKIELNEETLPDKLLTKRFNYVLCLMVGYHLGMEKESEVN